MHRPDTQRRRLRSRRAALPRPCHRYRRPGCRRQCRAHFHRCSPPRCPVRRRAQHQAPRPAGCPPGRPRRPHLRNRHPRPLSSPPTCPRRLQACHRVRHPPVPRRRRRPHRPLCIRARDRHQLRVQRRRCRPPPNPPGRHRRRRRSRPQASHRRGRARRQVTLRHHPFRPRVPPRPRAARRAPSRAECRPCRRRAPRRQHRALFRPQLRPHLRRSLRPTCLPQPRRINLATTGSGPEPRRTWTVAGRVRLARTTRSAS